MLLIEEGGEYRGERYVYCDSHPPGGHYSYGTGEIFTGTEVEELIKFLDDHRDCGLRWGQ